MDAGKIIGERRSGSRDRGIDAVNPREPLVGNDAVAPYVPIPGADALRGRQRYLALVEQCVQFDLRDGLACQRPQRAALGFVKAFGMRFDIDRAQAAKRQAPGGNERHAGIKADLRIVRDQRHVGGARIG